MTLSRRGFLAGIAALATTAALPAKIAAPLIEGIEWPASVETIAWKSWTHAAIVNDRWMRAIQAHADA